jgi:5-methylcytosine-specific restriction protein A
MVLAQQPFCVACQRVGRVALATDVDHIVPLSAGGTNAADNLQPLCHSCHSRKTSGGRGAQSL